MNRWIRLSAAVVAMIMIANLQYTWTLFTGPIIQATGWKLSDIQWGWTLFIALETWAMPFCGWTIDKRGARGLMTVAGVMCGVGWIGLGYASSLTMLYAFYALAGVGAALAARRAGHQCDLALQQAHPVPSLLRAPTARSRRPGAAPRGRAAGRGRGPRRRR